MDGPEGVAQMVTAVSAEFPILPDPGGEVVKAFGVYDLLGDGVAAPATFIIGEGRTIHWSHIGNNIADRPSAALLLERLQEMVR